MGESILHYIVSDFLTSPKSPTLVTWGKDACGVITMGTNMFNCRYLWFSAPRSWTLNEWYGKGKWHNVCKGLEVFSILFSSVVYQLLATLRVMQPFKLKFLLGHHLATNSFGLGRLFYKSSRQLQNFSCHHGKWSQLGGLWWGIWACNSGGGCRGYP